VKICTKIKEAAVDPHENFKGQKQTLIFFKQPKKNLENFHYKILNAKKT
jgi:hypothetical protein